MTAADVAELALWLANSGRRLTWDRDPPLADLASTGGPGSLSTLLAPLELRRFGCFVVKLAVPGRPAGGIDVLGTIPGYATRLGETDVRSAVTRCGYAHFLADDEFAPFDAALFAYRRENGAVAIPALAAASLLAKKLAMGLHAVGLDVRVGPHGNFGSTLEEARFNARLFCDAAREVGIRAVAFLSRSMEPEQPWIGRGEALVAVAQVLNGVATDDLAAHAARCFAMARETARLVGMDKEQMGATPLTVFADNLLAQGSSLEAFRQRAAETADFQRAPIFAGADGTVRVDLGILRDILVDAQRRSESEPALQGRFADPAGILLRRSYADPVRAGDIVARVRVSGHEMGAMIERTQLALSIVQSAPAAGVSPEMEIVRA